MQNHSEIHFFPGTTEGIVEKAIAPWKKGRVAYGGTYWPAMLLQSDCGAVLQKGETARIIGRQGITLLVLPKHFVVLHPPTTAIDRPPRSLKDDWKNFLFGGLLTTSIRLMLTLIIL